MAHHRYPADAIYADYLRAGGGLAVTAGPLLLLEVATPVAVVLSALALLFGWFALRTWTRQRSAIEVCDRAIQVVGPRPRRLAFADLAEMRLAYFAPRRTREHGWFELRLKGSGGDRLRLDSTLERFDALLARVYAEARDRGVPLSDTTRANLAALGLHGADRGADG